MSPRSEDPSRLGERHDQADPVERIAGQAARDLAEPRIPSALSLAAIAKRIEARSGRSQGATRLRWALVVGALVLGIVTAASAAHLDLVPRWLRRGVRGEPNSSPQASSSRSTRARAIAKVAAVPESPSPAADPEGTIPPLVLPPSSPQPPSTAAELPPSSSKPEAKVPAKGPSRTISPRKVSVAALLDERPAIPPTTLEASPYLAASSATRPAVTVEPPPGRPFDPPAQAPTLVPAQAIPVPTVAPAKMATAENPAHPTARSPAALHLKEIVQALRIEHSPRQALALLDRYSSELAGGVFADESLLLRVESMMALGERAAVLRLLDGRSLADVAASRVLLVTRGELRAAANRCAEGIGDFDLVLAEARRPPKQALLGRALCKQKLGDVAGAKADLERYEREFSGPPQSPDPNPRR